MVEDRLVTDVGGTIGVSVLSTPGMIAMMERNSAILSFEHLPEGKATVGFEVCVKHVAAAAEGATCTVTREAPRGRRRAQAALRRRGREGERTIGVGTHERRVIDVGVVKSEYAAQGGSGRDRAARACASGFARSARATASRTSPR